jgi:hypothetical protein
MSWGSMGPGKQGDFKANSLADSISISHRPNVDL